MNKKRVISLIAVLCVMLMLGSVANASTATVTRLNRQYRGTPKDSYVDTGVLSKPDAATWKYGEDDNVSSSTPKYYNRFRSENMQGSQSYQGNKNEMSNAGYISVAIDSDDNRLFLRLWSQNLGTPSSLLGRLYGSYEAW